MKFKAIKFSCLQTSTMSFNNSNNSCPDAGTPGNVPIYDSDVPQNFTKTTLQSLLQEGSILRRHLGDSRNPWRCK